jgi:hypothetical protein
MTRYCDIHVRKQCRLYNPDPLRQASGHHSGAEPQASSIHPNREATTHTLIGSPSCISHLSHTHNLPHNVLNHRTRRFPRISPSPRLGHQCRRRERCFCRQPRSRQECHQAGRSQGSRALRTSTMPSTPAYTPRKMLRINCILQCCTTITFHCRSSTPDQSMTA